MKLEERIARIDSLDFEALDKIVEQCHVTAEEHGWWEKYEGEDAAKFLDEVIASKLMLTVSEQAEALEEMRAGQDLTKVYYSRKTTTDNGYTVEYSDEPLPGFKPEGFGIELADSVVRIFDLARRNKIPLARFIRQKMVYNESRPFKHGGKKL